MYRDLALNWGVIVGFAAVMGLIVGSFVSFVIHGFRGPARVIHSIRLAASDLIFLAPRRVYALAWLTFQEALQRRALHAFIVGIPVFMFAQWFLQSADQTHISAKPYVVFVLTALKWMTLPVSLLLACWGLPQDIKDRSLHTVVTKPVRRSEVLLGRILGYWAMISVVMAVMGVVGYIWIQRSTPSRCQEQLIARVPIVPNILYFYDRQGQGGEGTVEGRQGINVGDIWEYRSYIEGGTKARAVWRFDTINWDFIQKQGGLKFEYRFEAFRSHKGVLGEQLRFDMWLRRPQPKPKEGEVGTTDTYTHKIKWPVSPPIQEYKETFDAAIVEMKLAELESLGVKDMLEGNGLEIEIACVESAQYVGMARTDLFVRLQDRPFAVSYGKTVLGLWLMNLLIIIIGCTGSCFLKGPVSTVLTFGLLVMGTFLRGTMDKMVLEFLNTPQGAVSGGGPIEALFRLLTQRNVQTPLDETTTTTMIKWTDFKIFSVLSIARHFIPDFTVFDTTWYVANGLDINLYAVVIPSLLMVISFLVPCLIIGYFALQVRELEAK